MGILDCRLIRAGYGDPTKAATAAGYAVGQDPTCHRLYRAGRARSRRLPPHLVGRHRRGTVRVRRLDRVPSDDSRAAPRQRHARLGGGHGGERVRAPDYMAVATTLEKQAESAAIIMCPYQESALIPVWAVCVRSAPAGIAGVRSETDPLANPVFSGWGSMSHRR